MWIFFSSKNQVKIKEENMLKGRKSKKTRGICLNFYLFESRKVCIFFFIIFLIYCECITNLEEEKNIFTIFIWVVVLFYQKNVWKLFKLIYATSTQTGRACEDLMRYVGWKKTSKRWEKKSTSILTLSQF